MLSFTLLSCLSIFTSSIIALPVTLTSVNLTIYNTQQANATWYYQGSAKGACGHYSTDAELVGGLPLEWYTDTSVVDPLCGSYIIVTSSVSNQTATIRVADASGQNRTLALSAASYAALDGPASNLVQVSWRFANSSETALAVAANAAVLDSDSFVSMLKEAFASLKLSGTSTAAHMATMSGIPLTVGHSTVSASTSAAVSTTVASTSSIYVTPYVSPTPAPAYTPPVVATTPKYTPPAPSTTPAVVAQSVQQPQAAATPKYSAPVDTYSGIATFFYQNGVAGACGTVHSDDVFIVAIDIRMWEGGANCGRTVKIVTNTGAVVTAVVQDQCPTCVSSGSLDLSIGAFHAIGKEEQGIIPMTWTFVN